MNIKQISLLLSIALIPAGPLLAEDTPIPQPIKIPPPTQAPVKSAPPVAEKKNEKKTETPVVKSIEPTKWDSKKSEKKEKETSSKEDKKTAKEEKKNQKSKPVVKTVKTEEEKNYPLTLKQNLHSKFNTQGNEVFFQTNEKIVFSGKIQQIEKPQKKEAGKFTINLDKITLASGKTISFNQSLEIASVPSESGRFSKDAVLLSGITQNVTVPGKLIPKVKPTSPAKETATESSAVIFSDSTLQVRIQDGKLPEKIELFFEVPESTSPENLNDTTLILTQINNFTLPKPITSEKSKIKWTDKNNNKLKEAAFSFKGWDLIQFLMSDENHLSFILNTKDGKILKGSGTLKVTFE